MATMKQRCNELRRIRMSVAKKYGVPYTPFECKSNGRSCKGICPQCEAEAAELLKYLKENVFESKQDWSIESLVMPDDAYGGCDLFVTREDDFAYDSSYTLELMEAIDWNPSKVDFMDIMFRPHNYKFNEEYDQLRNFEKCVNRVQRKRRS